MSLISSVSSNFTMDSATMAVAGGLLLGVVSMGKLYMNGNILGISGIVGGIFRPNNPQDPDQSWRWWFAAGFPIAGAALRLLAPEAVGERMMDAADASGVAKLVASGLLVGFGTAMSNGCTSGHGRQISYAGNNHELLHIHIY
jgi:uncharacterized membrane protein YedE/YeeE